MKYLQWMEYPSSQRITEQRNPFLLLALSVSGLAPFESFEHDFLERNNPLTTNSNPQEYFKI